MAGPHIPHRWFPEPWKAGIGWSVTFHVAHTGYVDEIETTCTVVRKGERARRSDPILFPIGPFENVLDAVRESMLLAACDVGSEQMRLFP